MELHDAAGAPPPLAVDLTPAAIVAALDAHIVGQRAAKRAVAIALRNRLRRQRVDPALRDDIAPKNIILIGPTGVGKTEIARRLSKLARAPFIKVEATKFTEVGYVGKDVESMIRDLVEAAIRDVRAEFEALQADSAADAADRRVVDALYPAGEATADPERQLRTREKLLSMLRGGHLDERGVEIEVTRAAPSPPGLHVLGADPGAGSVQDLLKGLMPPRRSRRKMPVREARAVLAREEAASRVDEERAVQEAIRRVEDSGIVFIDEIDKIAVKGGDGGRGPDVSRAGVQRDILPIVEGTTVQTRHGPVRTDHVLFIAAGAFHTTSVSDLIPELQGRFPIRVELEPLGATELRRILVEPRAALIRQYEATLQTEGVTLRFTEAAIDRIAAMAADVNARRENIGARRLHTVMEALLEPLSFDAPTRRGELVTIDVAEVEQRIGPLAGSDDLSRFIL